MENKEKKYQYHRGKVLNQHQDSKTKEIKKKRAIKQTKIQPTIQLHGEEPVLPN